ncbi:DUF4337 domain-containing protein [Dictyobacter formicarum]|uniref:DUF4337 domain-containing protein n=1 Tax=Dictyobacter formicarum TaxID=2778368 RepID=A0ABQ3VJ61_9CHLR|nr:DUF4337 domain-containing protein [Dictyobacter formicarum]GHO85942.1 hypothetical protein KSZ_39480 [Dictyobacter formicarum]
MLRREASEVKEKIEEVIEHGGHWNKYLAITTALIAVFTAIISSMAGNYSSEAFLQKNNAILYQNKASDQWSFYQAKSIKLNLALDFYEQTHNPQRKKDADRYQKEQDGIYHDAKHFESLAQAANDQSAQALEKGERLDTATLFCQIAIALSAMSALVKKEWLWIGSLLVTGVSVVIFVSGII